MQTIETIVNDILTLARRRKSTDLVSNIEAVKVEIGLELMEIVFTHKLIKMMKDNK